MSGRPVTPSDLTPYRYGEMRARLDTQRAVARALGVTTDTLQRRERGASPISVEAGLALRFLARHGLPAYLRARPTKEPPPANVEYGTPGELREALRILGWDGKTAARMILGPGESQRTRFSRMLSGERAWGEAVGALRGVWQAARVVQAR